MGVNRTWYWSDRDLEDLARLARERVPTKRIAERLNRSEKAVRNKASALHIPLTAFATKRALKRLESRGAVKEGSRYSRGPIRVTLDFDFSALTPEERLTLAARLLGLPLEGDRPVELPTAYDAVTAARARGLAVAAARREERKANGGKGPKWSKLTREERRARREAKRDEGIKKWMEEEKFREYLDTWREKEYVRDMLNG